MFHKTLAILCYLEMALDLEITLFPPSPPLFILNLLPTWMIKEVSSGHPVTYEFKCK